MLNYKTKGAFHRRSKTGQGERRIEICVAKFLVLPSASSMEIVALVVSSRSSVVNQLGGGARLVQWMLTTFIL